MWFKVKMTTKALLVLQKMFPQSTLHLHHLCLEPAVRACFLPRYSKTSLAHSIHTTLFMSVYLGGGGCLLLKRQH